MRRRLTRFAALGALSILAAGCAATAGSVDISDPKTGFANVSARTEKAIGKTPVWAQSQAEAQALAQKVRGLVKGKTVGPDLAVQVALLNNKGLQAAYAEVGLTASDVWQESLLINPTVSVGAPSIDVARTIEAAVVGNIIQLATRPRRIAVADTRFRQAQLRAAEETLRLAADTRRAWINAVAARETIAYLDRAQIAADAASELAKKLGETGAFPKVGQAREHVFNAELAGQAAQARLSARQAKEELSRRMGLWGEDLDYTIAGSLPRLPAKPSSKRAIETEALANRVDLDVAKLELEALAKSYGLTNATRYLTDLDLTAGTEIERESGEGGSTTNVAANLEVEFVIPIFDTGKARMRKAELAYMQAANLLAEKAVNTRSEARAAYDAYRSTYDIARHYRNSVVPLRTKIEEEAVLTYNGMITSTFELLADTRAKIDSMVMSIDAKQAFWLADVNLNAAIHGGGSGATEAAEATAGAAPQAGGGH